MEGFGPKLLSIGGVTISETVIVTWIVMALLTIGAYLTTRRYEKVPRGVQNAVETLVETINKLVADTMGEDKKKFAPYMGTLLLFILCTNLIGLLGFRPPTADFNTTLALALITFGMIHYYAVKSHGLGPYVKGYFEPFFLLFPLNLLGELAKPISLSFRLFGNLIGGLIIMSLIYGALGSFSTMLGFTSVPILQGIIPIVFHVYFDLFAGVLQSFIFLMLTMVFVTIAID